MSDSEVGRLLDRIEKHSSELSEDEAALIRVTRRDYDQATKIPPELLGRFYEHIAEAYQVWTQARAENDFPAVQAYLEKTVDFSRDIANCFPGYDHIADPLIDQADFGLKAESVRAIFAELRQALVPLVDAIQGQEPVDATILFQHYPEEAQLAVSKELAGQFGYDFKRGRIDKTHHPFMIKFSSGDVRITTRVDENNLGDNLFSVLHETGHALYEMGIDPGFEGTPLFGGTSAGVHESQSRLWENLVGRSRGYWVHQYPYLQQKFPSQLAGVSLDQFYRAINKVQPSLIRTEADEVTYNLHVMIRFDLELQMLEGTLAVKDLPEAWHARYDSDLGLRAPSDVDGCLQDVHWYSGPVGGGFQGYTLGNIMSALFYNAAVVAHPEIPDLITQGQYGTLHNWLQENIYKHGSKYTTNELIQRVTGGELTIAPYIRYLQNKYAQLYDLSGVPSL